jgi:hypothetical protein
VIFNFGSQATSLWTWLGPLLLFGASSTATGVAYSESSVIRRLAARPGQARRQRHRLSSNLIIGASNIIMSGTRTNHKMETVLVARPASTSSPLYRCRHSSDVRRSSRFRTERRCGSHVTLGRERPSGSICDSLAANGGGKYLPTYVRRVLAVS